MSLNWKLLSELDQVQYEWRGGVGHSVWICPNVACDHGWLVDDCALVVRGVQGLQGLVLAEPVPDLGEKTRRIVVKLQKP